MSTTNQLGDQQQFPRRAQGKQQRASHSHSKRKSWGSILAIIGTVAAIIGVLIALVSYFWPHPDGIPTPTPVITISPTPTPTPTPVNVTITSPKEGSKVPRLTEFKGTAFHIPQGEQLVVLVQPYSTSLYFPQTDNVTISMNDDTWNWGTYVGKEGSADVGKKFVLWAALADQAGLDAIKANLRKNNQMQTAQPGSDFDPLVGPLPPLGIQPIISVTVIRL